MVKRHAALKSQPEFSGFRYILTGFPARVHAILVRRIRRENHRDLPVEYGSAESRSLPSRLNAFQEL